MERRSDGEIVDGDNAAGSDSRGGRGRGGMETKIEEVSRLKRARYSIRHFEGVRGGGLGSSTIFKNLMSPTPRRKWYFTTGRRAH